jgi:D-lyxose ketol-isomerase
LRNGNFHDRQKYAKPYAEKIMIVEEGQVTPYHFHWSKMEDIINRGGGDLIVKVYNSTEDGKFADTDVDVYMDGRHFTVEAGTELRIKPGESISIQQGMYHSFWADGGKALVGEVSMVNDDTSDNRFYVEAGRFPAIDEDEAPLYLLGNEYPIAK